MNINSPNRKRQEFRVKEKIMNRAVSLIGCFCLALAVWTVPAVAQTPEQVAKMTAAMPGAPEVPPAKPRKLLVFTLSKGFVHSSIPYAAKALEIMGQKTGAFTATVTDDPAMFAPDKLAEFDAVCMDNTTGDPFTDDALKQSLVDFVKGGKGLIGIHAATDCFYDWAEYGDMMGGYFDGHPWGADTTVTIKVDDPLNPIDRVFHGRGFQVKDEIYQFKDPYSREKLRVLLSIDTSKTDMTRNGIKRTDGDFAVSWIRSYGQGRVFYCSLGHNEDIFWTPSILQFYLDGIQFALGDLTADTTPSAQLPADYQQKTKAAGQSEMLDDIFGEIAAYEPGKDPSGLEVVTDLVVKSYGDRQVRDDLEKRFDAVLKSANATFAGKQYAAKQLYIMGTDDSMDVLRPLLLDPEESDNARYAMQCMEPGEADIALHEAVDQAKGRVLIGLIDTIGERRNPRSVADLSRYAASDDEATAVAAVRALGKIGGQGAIDILTRERTRLTAPPDAKGPAPAPVPRERLRSIDDALMECADNLTASGNADAAVKVYNQLYAADIDPVTRLAAMQGLTVAQGNAAIPMLIGALWGDDATMRNGAAMAVQRLTGSDATKALADAVASVPAAGQALLVNALGKRGDVAALAAVTAALKSQDPAVRLAAIDAVAALGNDTSVEPLAAIAAGATGDEQQAARTALTLLKGDNVDNAIVAAMSTGNDGVRAELSRALGGRYASTAIPTLLKAAQDPSEAVRTQAFASLGMVAGADQLASLVDLMVKEQADGPRSEAERASIAVLARGGSPASEAQVVLNALANAKDDVRAQASLVRVLGKIVDPEALKALRDAAESRNTDVQLAAVRALADWPTADPADELVKVAGDTQDPAIADAALRGYLHLLEMPSERSDADAAQMYEAAFNVAKSTDARKLVLASLGNQSNGSLVGLIARYKDDPGLKAEAAAAMKKLQTKAFAPSASNNPGDVRNAIDGDPGTRWATNEAQKKGQWFMLDLGWEGTIDQVVLDAGSSTNDFPRGYEVYVSSDGKTWGSPVAIGAGVSPRTEINFLPVKGRYVKIVQTGSTDGFFWSIHEMTVDIH